MIVTQSTAIRARLEVTHFSLGELAISLHLYLRQPQVVLAVCDHLGGVGADKFAPPTVVVRRDACVLALHALAVDVDAEVFEVVGHDGVGTSVALRVVLCARAVAECVSAVGSCAVVVCHGVTVCAVDEAAVFDVAESHESVRHAILSAPS